jgi:hypothetical protein
MSHLDSVHVKSVLIASLHKIYEFFNVARDAIVEYLLDTVSSSLPTCLRCSAVECLGKIGQKHPNVLLILETPLRRLLQDTEPLPALRSACARSLGRLARSSARTKDWIRSNLRNLERDTSQTRLFLLQSIPFAFLEEPVVADGFVNDIIKKFDSMVAFDEEMDLVTEQLTRIASASAFTSAVQEALQSFHHRNHQSPISEHIFNRVRKMMFVKSQSPSVLMKHAAWIAHSLANGSEHATLLLNSNLATFGNGLPLSVACSTSFVKFRQTWTPRNVFEWTESCPYFTPSISSQFMGDPMMPLVKILSCDDETLAQLASLIGPVAQRGMDLIVNDFCLLRNRNLMQVLLHPSSRSHEGDFLIPESKIENKVRSEITRSLTKISFFCLVQVGHGGFVSTTLGLLVQALGVRCVTQPKQQPGTG